MKYLAAIILLTGCCSLKHPIDGKAKSWCEAEAIGTKLCADHGGLSGGYWNPVYINCTDGSRFERRHDGTDRGVDK